MTAVVVESLSGENWRLTNPGGNYANTSYPTRIATTTAPNKAATTTGLQAIGDGVVALGHEGSVCPQWLRLLPIGTGADEDTFTIKVLLWRSTRFNVVGQPGLWIPETLAEWTCTLCTQTGVAGADLDVTTRFVDTITMTGGPTLITNAAAPTALTAAPIVEKWFQTSPLGDQVGAIMVPTFGARFAEVIFKASGTNGANALWTLV